MAFLAVLSRPVAVFYPESSKVTQPILEPNGRTGDALTFDFQLDTITDQVGAGVQEAGRPDST